MYTNTPLIPNIQKLLNAMTTTQNPRLVPDVLRIIIPNVNTTGRAQEQ